MNGCDAQSQLVASFLFATIRQQDGKSQGLKALYPDSKRIVFSL